MNDARRIDRIEAAQEKTAANLDRLAQVVDTIATMHGDQIDKLIKVAEIQQQRWEQLQRDWQAYLTTIHPRQ